MILAQTIVAADDHANTSPERPSSKANGKPDVETSDNLLFITWLFALLLFDRAFCFPVTMSPDSTFYLLVWGPLRPELSLFLP